MTSVALSWVNPTSRNDAVNTPLPPSAIAQTNIFDAVNGAAAVQIGTAMGAATTFTTPPLAGGNHVFTAETVDSTGDDSIMSAPFAIAIPLAPPNPPTGLTGTIVPDTPASTTTAAKS